jgi:hypothetical protein
VERLLDLARGSGSAAGFIQTWERAAELAATKPAGKSLPRPSSVGVMCEDTLVITKTLPGLAVLSPSQGGNSPHGGQIADELDSTGFARRA